MKGKIGFDFITVPENLEEITHVWKTHVPSLSFKKYEVDTIYNHIESKNFSIVLKPLDGEKRGKRVICEWYKDRFVTKRNYHFSEANACKRLASNIADILTGNNINQKQPSEIINAGLDYLKDHYPELVL